MSEDGHELSRVNTFDNAEPVPDNPPMVDNPDRRSVMEHTQELDAIAVRLAELKKLEPTPALEREADAIEARLAEIEARLKLAAA